MAYNNIKFGITAIRVLSFSYQDPREIINDFNPENYPLEAKTNVNYRWNINKNFFAILLKIQYLIKDSNKETVELLSLSFTAEYTVENLAEIFHVKSNIDFEMNRELELTFLGIAISTGRGILYEKTKGTVFNNFIYPIINPQDLILSKQNRSNI